MRSRLTATVLILLLCMAVHGAEVVPGLSQRMKLDALEAAMGHRFMALKKHRIEKGETQVLIYRGSATSGPPSTELWIYIENPRDKGTWWLYLWKPLVRERLFLKDKGDEVLFLDEYEKAQLTIRIQSFVTFATDLPAPNRAPALPEKNGP